MNGDSYLETARAALEESLQALNSAGSHFISEEEIRKQLSSEHGIAANGIQRALRDLQAHEERVGRRADRDTVEAYLQSVGHGYSPRKDTQIVHLVVPLPLEENRLDDAELRTDQAGRNVNSLAVAFANETMRELGPWLMDVESISWGYQDGYFHYTVHAQRSTTLLRELRIYASGMIAYRRPILGGWKERNVFALEEYTKSLIGMLRFAERLYDHWKIRPRNVGLQSVLVNVGHHLLLTPGLFKEYTVLEKQPREAATEQLFVPREPRMVPYAELARLTPTLVADLAALLEGHFETVKS